MKKTLAALLMCVCAVAHAKTPKNYITESDFNVVYATTPHTLSDNNGVVVNAWVRVVNKQTRYIQMELTQIHCASGQYRVIAISTYNSQNALIDQFQDPNAQWYLQVPETLAVAYQRYFCRKVKVTNW